MSQCPCGSQNEYATCCEPFIKGTSLPPTAEALMRSRYTAHAKGEVDYIVKTVHPDRRDQHDANAIREWSQSSDWQKLEIIATDCGRAEDEIGTVEFTASYRDAKGPRTHHEIAKFRKVEGRWFFHDGAPPKITQVVRDSPKIGRNDPCICGSGKKYKKCCYRA